MKSWVYHSDSIPMEDHFGQDCLEQSLLTQHSQSETIHHMIHTAWMLAVAPL